MASVAYKNCKKCIKKTKHRLVTDNRLNRGNYYFCTICSENSSKKHRNKYWLRYIAQKANARKRPGSTMVTEKLLQVIYDSQEGKCALSGLLFDMNNSDYKPSIDRIDSSKGYDIMNIQLVCWIVNKMKRDLEQEIFIMMCKRIFCHKNNIYIGNL